MAFRDEGPTLVGTLWMETAICLIVVLLRLYTRTMIRRNAGWDDVLIITTLVLMAAFSILCTVSAWYGMGVHSSYLSQDEYAKAMLLLLSGQSVISIAMGTSKCAVAVFLMRIIVNKWQMAFLWFWFITIMFLGIFQCIVIWLQCTPTESIYDPRVKPKGCTINLTIVATVICSWSAIMDFVLAIFPWMTLWKLNMKKKEKLSICLSLSLGVFAGICGIVRTTGLNVLSNSTDYLYAVTDSAIWTNSEITTTLVCLSIPALRPLYRSLRGKASSNDESHYNNLPPYGKSSTGRSRRSADANFTLDELVTTTIQGKSDFPESSAASHSDTNDPGDEGDTSHILKNRPLDTHNIYQVKEVTVSYEDRRAGEGASGENLPSAPVNAKLHV